MVVALLDLDHFKAFNDTHGHQTGDFLLQTCVRVWRAELRQGDALARWGGEEFAVLLPDCTVEAAGPVLERLRGVVPAGCTVSIGATAWRAEEDCARALARADAALYAAKGGGRDRVVWDGWAPQPAGIVAQSRPGSPRERAPRPRDPV